MHTNLQITPLRRPEKSLRPNNLTVVIVVARKIYSGSTSGEFISKFIWIYDTKVDPE